MPSIPLSVETRRRVDLLFPPAQREEVVELLVQRCGNNLPFLADADEVLLERFRFAALKVSGGSLDGLREAVDLANIDWRDLLVAAGFANQLDAHKSWLP